MDPIFLQYAALMLGFGLIMFYLGKKSGMENGVTGLIAMLVDKKVIHLVKDSNGNITNFLPFRDK